MNLQRRLSPVDLAVARQARATVSRAAFVLVLPLVARQVPEDRGSQVRSLQIVQLLVELRHRARGANGYRFLEENVPGVETRTEHVDRDARLRLPRRRRSDGASEEW